MEIRFVSDYVVTDLGFRVNISSIYNMCGDGVVSGLEMCDIGSSSSPGCINCEIQFGWSCNGLECTSKSQVMRMSEILLLFQVCGAVRAFVTVGVRTAPCRHTRAWVPAGNRGFQALSVGCRVRNETCHV